MKLIKLFTTCLLLIYLTEGRTQTEINIDLSGSCSYYGEEIEETIYGFSSSQEATNAIERIVNAVGLRRNFEIKAANVPNAAAVIEGSTRYILYSQNFINQVNSATGSKWAAISILAHEVGHHLNGHTLESSGSRPPIELEADEFSGFVLARMGATLNQAQLAMSTLSSNAGSATHPPKSARLEAIAVGWSKANDSVDGDSQNNGSSDSDNSDIRPPNIPSTTPGSNSVQFISRCIFNGDGHHYFVTNTNVIVGFNPFTNQSAIIGQKMPSNDPRFAWFYVTSTVRYAVDFNGRIWSQNGYGQPVQVGFVTDP